MEAAKQALVDEFVAAEKSIQEAITEACWKLQGKLGGVFKPEWGGKRGIISRYINNALRHCEDVVLPLRTARAVVDAPSLEEMIQRDKEARVPVEFTAIPDGDGKFREVRIHVKREEGVEFTAIPDGDGKFRGVKIHAKHEEADNHGSGKTSVDR